ncbi:MAG: hypothetical protein JNG86_15255 [Verrucomicrobiaceae bacterium]|nr:hypothetical protein [Verrucomicrobiaceae bacterium]
MFELLTHQVSGTMFDPMVTPWHAVMMLALPVGIGFCLSSKKATASAVGWACVSFGLPLTFLLVWAIRDDHLTAIMKFVIGTLYLATHPQESMRVLFGDYYVSPVAALAYLGPLAGCGMAVSLLCRQGAADYKKAVVPAFLIGAVLVAYLEFSSSSLEHEISKGCHDLEAGHEIHAPPILKTEHARDVIARLSRPAQQFSSHGSLYAVGPVDVFGPWTYIRRGRPHPVEVLYQTKWPKYSKLYEALWPGQSPRPSAWRGLSPWEKLNP